MVVPNSKVILIGCCMLFMQHASSGQGTWRRTYGGLGSDNALGIAQCSDGGFVVVGSTGSFGNGASDIYLVRLDVLGYPQWSQVYGGPGVDQGVACHELPDGFIIAGTSSTGTLGGYDMTLLRTNTAGEVLWQRFYGTADWDFCNAMVVQSDGFLLVGTSYGPDSPAGSGFAVHTDPSGDEEWSYSMDGDAHSEVFGVSLASDGDALLVGAVEGADGLSDGFVLRLGGSGEEEWFALLESDSANSCSGVAEGWNGDVVACGTSRADWPVQRIHLAGLSGTGVPLWEQFIGNSADAGGAAIDRAHGSGYVITGYNTLNFGERDMIFTRVDDGGWFQTGNNFGDGQPADGAAIQRTLDGGYVVAGWCENYGPGPRAMYVVKTDLNGATSSLNVNTYQDPLRITSHSWSCTDLMVYPNPVASGSLIQIQLPSVGDYGVTIVDARGLLCWTGHMTAGGAIDLTDIPAGAYTLLLTGIVDHTERRALFVIE